MASKISKFFSTRYAHSYHCILELGAIRYWLVSTAVDFQLPSNQSTEHPLSFAKNPLFGGFPSSRPHPPVPFEALSCFNIMQIAINEHHIPELKIIISDGWPNGQLL